MLTLPVPVGPSIPGLPDTPDGFIPVDEHGAVTGLDGVYAAGDVTDFPIKQGGLAAQQAVAAAEAIAARHGADLDPQPYRPMLRGMLLTGGQSRWLRATGGQDARHRRRRSRALVAADEDRDALPGAVSDRAGRRRVPAVAPPRRPSRGAGPRAARLGR